MITLSRPPIVSHTLQSIGVPQSVAVQHLFELSVSGVDTALSRMQSAENQQSQRCSEVQSLQVLQGTCSHHLPSSSFV